MDAVKSAITNRTALTVFRIGSLLLVLLVGSFVPSWTTLTTCRCCLWTSACAIFPAQGSYRVVDHGGAVYSGIYNKADHQTWQEYRYEDVSVRRIRFGWPLKAITIDTVGDGSEWHRVFESCFWDNLFVLFLLWLLIQPVLTFVAGKLARNGLRPPR
jgi:hypothetical protein